MLNRLRRLDRLRVANQFGDRALVEQPASNEAMALDSFGGRIHVRWSQYEAVTPDGQSPFSTALLGHE